MYHYKLNTDLNQFNLRRLKFSATNDFCKWKLETDGTAGASFVDFPGYTNLLEFLWNALKLYNFVDPRDDPLQSRIRTKSISCSCWNSMFNKLTADNLSGIFQHCSSLFFAYWYFMQKNEDPLGKLNEKTVYLLRNYSLISGLEMKALLRWNDIKVVVFYHLSDQFIKKKKKLEKAASHVQGL